MSSLISFHSRNKTALQGLAEELRASAPDGLSISSEGVQPELGLGEAWFTLEAVLAFSAGVASKVIANQISNALSAAIERYRKKEMKEEPHDGEPLIEIRVDGKSVSSQRLSEVLEISALKKPDGQG